MPDRRERGQRVEEPCLELRLTVRLSERTVRVLASGSAAALIALIAPIGGARGWG